MVHFQTADVIHKEAQCMGANSNTASDDNQDSLTNRAERALTAWQEAINSWKEPRESPAKIDQRRICRPWSSEDYYRRLQTFNIENRETIALAAEGFEKADNSTIKCFACGAEVNSFPEREHHRSCPWKGRPYAALRTNWESSFSETGSLFDNIRQTLGSMEDVRRAMKDIRETH